MNAAVAAPVGWPEPFGTQVLPDIVGRQLPGKMVIQELREAGNHISRPSYQRACVSVQGVPQAPLVDGADSDPLQPPPGLLARNARPSVAQVIPRRPLVLGRNELALEFGKISGHHRALGQVL